LAFVHEWNLAYNASPPIRAIAGKQPGAQIVQFPGETITAAGSQMGENMTSSSVRMDPSCRSSVLPIHLP
jgi:hypothetical protein